MSCAPTTTVATPTMAAAAVPSAACARRRLGAEGPGLTVVIGFLQLLFLASAYVKACSMRAWLSSVLATKPLEAGHKPRIPASWNADRRPVAVSTHRIDRNAGYTGLAAQPTTSVRRGRTPR